MEKKLNKKDLINIFIRSNFLLGSFNFERMQAIGFCVSLLPALRKVYKDDKPAMAAAMKRHLEFFNTQPFLATPIMGITALGAGIALTGSIMGPLIFFLVFNAIRLATNWYGVMYGYSKGTELVDEMGGNKMRFLTEGSSVLGLLVMGALVAKWTTVNMPLVLSSYTNSAGEQVTTTVQTILDSLMPGIVPLLMTFACMWLLRKNVNPLIIILGLFALGIVGYAIGLFA